MGYILFYGGYYETTANISGSSNSTACITCNQLDKGNISNKRQHSRYRRKT